MIQEKRRKKLGEILVSQGYITLDQLDKGLQEHRRNGVSLGTVLVKMGYIDAEALKMVLGKQIEINQKKRIGEILVDQGLINKQQLELGMTEHKRTGVQLGQALVKLGFIDEAKLVDILSAQLDIQHVVLENFQFNKDLIRLIPEDMARKYKIVPLYEKEGILTVAMADPTNLRTIDHLKFKTGKEIEPVIAPEKSILNAIAGQYTSDLEAITKYIERTGDDAQLDIIKKEEDKEDEDLMDEEGAQIVKIVNLIIMQAIRENASDIHIEPTEKNLRVRYRIDGELQEKNPIPIVLRAPIISRIKLLANMDIAEKRKPQDGRFQIRFNNKEVDLRISTFPSMTQRKGAVEKIVVRILSSDAAYVSLERLGFYEKMLRRFTEVMSRPEGIVLVTGPTGSGKTTTLYAALKVVSTPLVNVVTLEDPVEYHIDGITQGQTNDKAGFNFANGLRSILRQDPDIIMVGEMRDSETAEIAIQASLTGHLVLSTLHTNDAPGAITRLIDMGIEPFLISSCIIGILAQRLVRKICENCRTEYQPLQELLDRVRLKQGTKLFHGKGCRMCNGSGYKGRLGLFELLIPDDNIRRMMIGRESANEIKNYAVKQGMDVLRIDGLRKALDGLTTLEEVIAATVEN